MNSVIGIIFTTIPFLVIALMSLAFVGYAGATLVWPRFLVYPYLGILFWANSSHYGSLEAVAPTLYTRGSNILYFSLLFWLLLAAMLWAKLSVAFERRQAAQCNLLPWFSAWAVLLSGHICIGLFLEIPFKEIISVAGISNIVWMAALIILIQLGFRNQKELAEFSKFIILVGLARAAFGLVRWIAFGGDPSNVYENYGKLDLKLTFFDINDGLVCWLALCVAAVQLLRPGQDEFSRMWRFILWMTIVICVTCIILSFRRTAWIGLILGSIFLLMHLPSRRRIQVALLGIPTILAGVLYAAWKRLSQTKGAGGLESFFHDLQSNDIGEEGARVLELKLVWADFIEHPIFGIGSWGRYKGHEFIAWQTGEAGGTFVHSGILHIALKSGLVGLVLMVGLISAFIHFWLKNKSAIEQTAQPLAIAGVAGIIFMIPDLIIGTPISEIRTMQMLALCLALPYVAYGAGGHNPHTAEVSITTLGTR